MQAKIFGAILIIVSTALYGFRYSLLPYKRYKNLIMMQTGLDILENEILFSSDYIDDIFLRISRLLKCEQIFKTAAEFSKDISIGKRWEKALKKDRDKLNFTSEDCEVLSLLGAELGITDKDGQIKNIKHIKSLVNKQVSDAQAEYKKSSKLFKSLGIALGAFMVILLL